MIKYTFTDDEKVILKNIDSQWTHLHRDQYGDLEVMNMEEHKGKLIPKSYELMPMFNHIFNTVHSGSKCNFREILEEENQ